MRQPLSSYPTPIFFMRLRPNGFSMVEVALAIGLVTFALVSLIGLITVGLTTSKESESDFRTVVIAEKVFQAVKTDLATQDAFTTPPSPWSGVPPSRYYWFDDKGDAVDAGDSTRFFRAQVTIAPLAQYPANVDNGRLKAVTIELAWPASALTSATASATVQKSNFSRLLRNPGFYTP